MEAEAAALTGGPAGYGGAGLDGLRGAAVVLVLLFHASLSIFAAVRGAPNVQPFGGADLQVKGWHLWDYVLNQGRYGVHLFFILSGFILGLPFVSGSPSLRAFYKRRLTRLEPPYLIALVPVSHPS